MENNILKIEKPVHENLYSKIMETKSFKQKWYNELKRFKNNVPWAIACRTLIEYYIANQETSKDSETKMRKAFIDVRFVIIAFCQWLDSHNKEFLLTDINFRRRFRQFKNTVAEHGTHEVENLTWITPVAKLEGWFNQQ